MSIKTPAKKYEIHNTINYEENIRNLVVNGKEKFRLVAEGMVEEDPEWSDPLKYAKGKINFNFNDQYKDSNGVNHYIYRTDSKYKSTGGRWLSWSYEWATENIFVFYRDGFYKKVWDRDDDCYKYNKHYYQDLSDIEETFVEEFGVDPPKSCLHEGVTFLGWFTKKDGGAGPIRNIDDLKLYTDIFNWKKDESLPTVTLYAHWDIPSYRLTIHNVVSNGAKSSFIYYDEKAKKNKKLVGGSITRYILLRTNVKKYINEVLKIKDMKYISWAAAEASNYLGKKEDREKLKKERKFICWFFSYDGNDKDWSRIHLYLWEWYSSGAHPNVNVGIEKDRDVYPAFESIVIYPKTKLPDGKIFNGKIVCVQGKAINGLYPSEVDEYERNYFTNGRWIGFAPVYPEGQYKEYKNEKENWWKHYAWRPSKTDNPRAHQTWFGEACFSCTTVESFTLVSSGILWTYA